MLFVVGWLVGRLVGLLVGWLVGWLAGWFLPAPSKRMPVTKIDSTQVCS